MQLEQIHVLVSGTVQGVGFRMFAARESHPLNLTGWVRNLPTGQVEATAEGTEAELTLWLARLKEGPPHARVHQVEIISRQPIQRRQHPSFEIRR